MRAFQKNGRPFFCRIRFLPCLLAAGGRSRIYFVMKLHPVRCGLSLGLCFSILLGLLGAVAGLFHWGSEWVHFYRGLFWGYDVTLVGIGMGLLWGFAFGFAMGWLFTAIFNFFAYLDEDRDFE